MNHTKQPLTLLRLSLPCLLAALLCSCAATSVKNTWKAPDGRMPVTKIAVVAVADRGLLRQGFENRFYSELLKAGAKPVTTFGLISLPEIKQDKRAAAERFRAGGADAVLILRLVDRTSAYREVQAGPERYAPVVTGFDTIGWYDYYSVSFMGMSSSYATTKDKIYLETSLHDLTTEKRLWSALTETVLTDDMDRVGEMDPLIEKIVATMKKDGVIP